MEEHHIQQTSLHSGDAPLSFTSFTVKWCFNDPLNFKVYPNGPVLSWPSVPLTGRVVNAPLMEDQVTFICDTSHIPSRGHRA